MVGLSFLEKSQDTLHKTFVWLQQQVSKCFGGFEKVAFTIYTHSNTRWLSLSYPKFHDVPLRSSMTKSCWCYEQIVQFRDPGRMEINDMDFWIVNNCMYVFCCSGRSWKLYDRYFNTRNIFVYQYNIYIFKSHRIHVWHTYQHLP